MKISYSDHAILSKLCISGALFNNYNNTLALSLIEHSLVILIFEKKKKKKKELAIYTINYRIKNIYGALCLTKSKFCRTMSGNKVTKS